MGETFGWTDGRSAICRPPAFAGTLRTIGKLLDQLDDAKVRDEIGFPVEETGVYAQSSFLVPRTPADLARRSRAFAHWARETSGVMSRLSDYARSLVTGWYGAREQLNRLDPRFADKIDAYIGKRATAICF